MAEITFIIGPDGTLTAEGIDAAALEPMIGQSEEVNCARPIMGLLDLSRYADATDPADSLRVHRIYHGSVVDGPGVRSVLQVQGCPIRCKGCYVPQTHDESGGVGMSVADVEQALLDPRYQRDGVTFLGGEPMAQASRLAPLASKLVQAGINLCLYTGYTCEWIEHYGSQDQRDLLMLADVVIDGPYVQKLGSGAGEYRGSTNQRVTVKEETR